MSEPGKAVFLSYASQDAEAAKRICDALRSAGVEVWFDAEGGLEHGDEWDAKIRRQIKECVLFVAVISANTQAREEGYFRIEWELAAQRALGIASGVAFILPVVIDDTREPDALVPDRFRAVQWTRLKGGEVPPEVLARFLKLWSHRTGALKHEAGRSGMEPERPSERGSGSATAATEREDAASSRGGKRGLPLALLVAGGLMVAALLAVGLYFFTRPRRSPEDIAQALKQAQELTAAATKLVPPTNLPAPAPLSEARQLVAKARALFVNRIDTTRDDCALAADLLKQALAKDPSDAEVWAAESQLHSYYLLRSWDGSDVRRESARQAAKRAVGLDPQSFEARLAGAFLLADLGPEAPEKERQLRELRREQPDNPRLLRALATVLDRSGRLDEANAVNDESARLPGGDPLALYNKSLNLWYAGRTIEAEAALAESLAQRPFTGALLIEAWYAAVLHGDLERVRAVIAKIPPQDMLEDRAAYFAWVFNMMGRQPDGAIQRLRAVPRDWLSDAWYRGPKSRLLGDALALAGRQNAAVVEWRQALRLVDERLAATPNNVMLLHNRVQLLALLGEREEAERGFATMTQLVGINLATSDQVVGVPITNTCILLDRKAEALRQIARGLKRERRAVDYTAAILRLDPRFDPLRGEPEFARLIAEAEAIESAAGMPAPARRDWPTDPELKRAFDLVNGWDSTPESYALAEDLVKGVLARRPTDAEATITCAIVNNSYLNRGFDSSDERHVQARRWAERALQLAPDDPEALAAMAQCLTFRHADYRRAEELIRRAIARSPGESRYHRILGFNVLLPVRPAEAVRVSQEAASLFPEDPLVHYNLALACRRTGDLKLMEKALDRCLAVAPISAALIWKGWLAAWEHGDLPGFKSWLDRIPGNMRLNDRTVFMRYVYACLSGDVADGLQAVNGLAGTWLSDYYYTGPRDLLRGDLEALAGKPELARDHYERALAEIARRKAALPNDVTAEPAEAWTLLHLGRKEEARAVVRLLNGRLTRPYRPIYMIWWHLPIPLQLLLGERAEALALIREAAASPTAQAQLRMAFRIDPRMAPWRDDPEIQALLAAPAAGRTPNSP